MKVEEKMSDRKTRKTQKSPDDVREDDANIRDGCEATENGQVPAQEEDGGQRMPE